MGWDGMQIVALAPSVEVDVEVKDKASFFLLERRSRHCSAVLYIFSSLGRYRSNALHFTVSKPFSFGLMLGGFYFCTLKYIHHMV